MRACVPVCACRTLLRAPPWWISAAERHLSGWRWHLATTASCLSQPGPSQTYQRHILYVVASLSVANSSDVVREIQNGRRGRPGRFCSCLCAASLQVPQPAPEKKEKIKTVKLLSPAGSCDGTSNAIEPETEPGCRVVWLCKHVWKQPGPLTLSRRSLAVWMSSSAGLTTNPPLDHSPEIWIRRRPNKLD